MTENTSAPAVETEQPDPEEFNLADWLTGGTDHRARKRVTIYRDASLAAEIEEVERLMREAEKTPEGMESMGDTTPADLEARKTDLLQKLEASKATVEVFGLIDDELEACRRETGLTGKNDQPERETAFWYAVASRAATLNGQTLTADQWARVHQTIGAQFTAIVQAHGAASRADVTPQFRR